MTIRRETIIAGAEDHNATAVEELPYLDTVAKELGDGASQGGPSNNDWLEKLLQTEPDAVAEMPPDDSLNLDLGFGHFTGFLTIKDGKAAMESFAREESPPRTWEEGHQERISLLEEWLRNDDGEDTDKTARWIKSLEEERAATPPTHIVQYNLELPGLGFLRGEAWDHEATEYFPVIDKRGKQDLTK